MNPIVVSVTLAAAAANNISLSQTPTAATGFALNGTTAGVLDVQRRVLFTTAANETGHNATITGTNKSGSVISEIVALPNIGTVVSILDYKTVTKISISVNATGAITVGTNGTASTEWFFPSREMTPFNISAAIQTGAGTTANLDYTYDDPNIYLQTGYPAGSVNPNSITPPVLWQPTGALGTGVTATKADNQPTATAPLGLTGPVFAVRMTVTAGTNLATFWMIQAGING